jgi:hypothetical protein
LKPPGRRAFTTLALLALAAFVAILLFSDPAAYLSHYRGAELRLMLGIAAMLATATAAITAAFFAAVPGRSWLWVATPLPPLGLWLLLGINQLRDLVVREGDLWNAGDSLHCFLFILGVGLVTAALLSWRLRRAAPLEALAVATLSGLGAAAFAAFLLNFFHPFPATPIDLAVHAASVLLVVAFSASLRRMALGPA